MSDLAPILERLGLEQYLDLFISEGFDTWETLTDIQESDFDALNVKLGHRRKLQRAIAEYRGIPFERLLGSAAQEAQPESGRATEAVVAGPSEAERPSGPPPEAKRKYRRHPKPDENAPERPPSAYVIFSNRIREEVKDQNLSFTQIAKLVGDRWQKLDPAGKEPFEAQASAAKERYNIQLSVYRKTDEYKEYMAYLADFKAKHGQTAEAKRPKLEPESSGSIISTKSFEASHEGTAPPSGHFRGSSMGSSASSPFIGGGTQQTGSGTPAPPRPRLPSSRSGSPPPALQSREHFRPGLISGHSSVSDESATVKSEVPDTVTRTAGLSLGAPSATPPLPTFTPSASAGDSAPGHDPLARSRLSYFVQSQQPVPSHMSNVGISPPGQGSLSYQQNLPSPTTQESSWRSRPPEFRGYQETPRALPGSYPHSTQGREQISPTQLPPLLSQDQLSNYHPAASPRHLPLPRAPSAGTSSLPHLARAMEPPRPMTEPLQIRQQARDDGRPGLNRSESDAATTLAGLAAGVARPDPPKPHSPGPPRRPRPSP
ncbi:hypothetical protein A1O7_01726 [Cladophialophora yegresii CBS 114405]|uniref:HMG box domain-containing protein n=1 Tax=Cladophialophora yegresii CBS 114405 TaxID=1182544 RepID=W9WK78_9EURO|nr:uncharacterized protein A1O7_01726 [Cladophialophora yegresii CBS 114405]EXJ65385.1 hypothetical protein A1O7_01726 [Cladophialophora yegresii CBS 114405]